MQGNLKEKSIFRNEHFALILLILLHLIIALPLACFLNIWMDEASTLYTTEHGLRYAFQNTLADEKQAPLYFWFMSLWRTIDNSIFFARLFSIICSCLAIKFFNDLARKVFAPRTAFYATAFFALHPYLFWASLEIRVYSSVILLAVLLLNFFYDGYFETDSKTQKRARIFYVILSVIALYTNYYLGFLLVGNFIALPVLRKWRESRSYFWQMIAVGIIFLPLVLAIKSQFSANASGFQEEKSLAEGFRVLWNVFLTFALPTEIFTTEEISIVSFFRLWLVRLGILAGFILIIKNRRKLNEKFIAFGTICAVVCLFLLAAYFLLGIVYAATRHMAVLFAPLVIFIWLTLESTLLQPEKVSALEYRRSKRRSLAQLAVLILFTASFSYAIYTLYPNLTKRGDWARVGDFLEKTEQPNQPIIVFTTFEALALPYHYKGINRILPDEKFFDWENEAEIGSDDSRKREIEFIISKIPPDSREIWLLTNSGCLDGQTCLPLENYVQANYTVVEEKDFYKEKVRLLRKK